MGSFGSYINFELWNGWIMCPSYGGILCENLIFSNMVYNLLLMNDLSWVEISEEALKNNVRQFRGLVMAM